MPDGRRVTIVLGEVILTMGPIGDVRNGAVAFADGEIVEVGPAVELRTKFPDALVVGDGRGVVMPGLVNAHTHLSEALVPGMGERYTLFEWGQRIVGPIGRHLTRRMGEVGALLKIAEMAMTGVTTVNDMFVHTNLGSLASLGAVDALRTVGFRGLVAFGAEDMFDPHPVGAFIAEHEALAAHIGDDPLIGFRLGVGTILGQSDELLAASSRLVREHSWQVHTHLAEVREELVDGLRRFGRTTVSHAGRLGLLDTGATVAHAIWLREEDRETLAATRTGVVHNPVANMILASGVCRVGELRRAGIPVGIGTDGAASNDSQDMLGAVKSAPLVQKVHRLDPAALTAVDALRMATIEGAQALRLDDRIGSLEPGKRADIVRFRGDGPGLVVLHDPYQQVVYCATAPDVSDVWVDGQAVVRDGRFIAFDLSEVRGEAAGLAAELVQRAGLGEHSWLA